MRIGMTMPVLLVTLMAMAAACTKGPAPADSASAPAATPVDSARLVGKWQRPDGGYVLEIRAATEDGKLDAGYFNPKPIHVAQATWRRSDELGLVVFIELRDVNYPGATYRLQYRPADDSLAGAYTQPAVGQTFEVVFQKQP